MLNSVETPLAPAAIGPYSQGIQMESWVFTSGQLPLNPATGEMPKDIEAQARQSLNNVKAVLEAAGSGMDSVIKVVIFLTDMQVFPVVNKVYAEFFTAPCPARSCVAVAALPKGADIEIEAIGIRRA